MSANSCAIWSSWDLRSRMKLDAAHFRIRCLQEPSQSHYVRASRSTTTTRRDLQETVRSQSEQAWAKAETQASITVLGFREFIHVQGLLGYEGESNSSLNLSRRCLCLLRGRL